MRVVSREDIRHIFVRYPAEGTYVPHELSLSVRLEELIDMLYQHKIEAQFVVTLADRKFYPLDMQARLRFTVIVPGFDTLEQATLWWDTCNQ